jgi:eukaryotic-like serine/threonine-protein kinase
MILEMVNDGDLKKYIKQRAPLMEYEIKDIFIQLSQALKSIHELGIVHRDLKLSNIMVHRD